MISILVVRSAVRLRNEVVPRRQEASQLRTASATVTSRP